jgi:hypothetical protein
MVFEWLKDLLFTPKRRQILEIEDWCSVLEQRIQRLEGTSGVRKREADKEERNERQQEAIGKVVLLLKEGKSPQDAMKAVAVEYPDVALHFAKKFGLGI